MWLFSKKQIEKLVKKIVADNKISNDLVVSQEIAKVIKDDLMRMNDHLIRAIDVAQKSSDTNTQSITVLGESLGHMLTAFTSMNQRLMDLEDQLSTKNVKFSKQTDN